MEFHLTGKNYNRYFVDLIRHIDRQGVINASEVSEHLAKSGADSSRYPDDASFRKAITDLPLYGILAQYKVRAILEVLYVHAQILKSELLPLPQNLTIEQILPQSWQAHWPMATMNGASAEERDPAGAQQSVQRRDRLVNSLGNLTLIMGSLNPSLSNSAWDSKRPELKSTAS